MLVPLGSTCFSFQQSQVYITSFFHNTKSLMWTGTQPSIGRMKSIFRLFPSFWRLIAKPGQRWQPYLIEYAKSTTRKRDWITAVKKWSELPWAWVDARLQGLRRSQFRRGNLWRSQFRVRSFRRGHLWRRGFRWRLGRGKGLALGRNILYTQSTQLNI